MRFRLSQTLIILSVIPLLGQAALAQTALQDSSSASPGKPFIDMPTPVSTDNDTACGALLCLAGEAMGHGGGSACSGYMASYFSIVRFHHGDFSPSRTASARMDFLNACKSGDGGTKQTVNSRYGRQWTGP